MPAAENAPAPARSREETTVPILATRALLAALTAAGLVLLVVGTWFTVHLGSSGSATFRAAPADDSVVVLEPDVLNRVDRPVTVTATARDGGPVFMGLASPSDARAIVGGAGRTTVTGVDVREWSLTTTRAGAGAASALAGADIWRQLRDGKGAVRLRLDPDHAPESLVIATRDGSPADLTSLTLTVERRTWFFQALLATLVGLLASLAGAAGLWHSRSQAAARTPGQTDPVSEGPGEEVPS